MPYFLQITDRDQAYLATLPLSDTAKESVEDFIHYGIAEVTDAFRSDPANRTQPDTRYFYRDLVLFDASGDRKYHQIVFFINDEHAASGVLTIAFIDHHQYLTTGPG